MARASSGSRSSINSVEPLMSANSAVTVLRSPSITDETSVWEAATRKSGGVSRRDPGMLPAENAAPQSPQNFAPGRLAKPHLGQRRVKAAPHSIQNLVVSGFSELQLGQRNLPSLKDRANFYPFSTARCRSVSGLGSIR